MRDDQALSAPEFVDGALRNALFYTTATGAVDATLTLLNHCNTGEVRIINGATAFAGTGGSAPPSPHGLSGGRGFDDAMLYSNELCALTLAQAFDLAGLETFPFNSRVLSVLSLSNLGLDDESVVVLTASMRFLPDLIDLDLSWNNIGTRGINARTSVS